MDKNNNLTENYISDKVMTKTVQDINQQSGQISNLVIGLEASIPLTIYGDLVNKYNKLTEENKELRAKLLSASMDYDKTALQLKVITLENEKLNCDMTTLKKENDTLRKEIATLKKENNYLRQQVNLLKKEVTELKTNNNILMKEKTDRENMMITAEIVMLYERAIVKSIIGEDDTRVTYEQLVTNSCILTEDQEKRWDNFKNEQFNYFNDGIDGLNYNLKFLKRDRNYYSHDEFKSPELTINDARNKMNAYVNSKGKLDDLKEFNSYLLDELRNTYKLGDKPFGNETFVKRSKFKGRK